MFGFSLLQPHSGTLFVSTAHVPAHFCMYTGICTCTYVHAVDLCLPGVTVEFNSVWCCAAAPAVLQCPALDWQVLLLFVQVKVTSGGGGGGSALYCLCCPFISVLLWTSTSRVFFQLLWSSDRFSRPASCQTSLSGWTGLPAGLHLLASLPHWLSLAICPPFIYYLAWQLLDLLNEHTGDAVSHEQLSWAFRRQRCIIDTISDHFWAEYDRSV